MSDRRPPALAIAACAALASGCLYVDEEGDDAVMRLAARDDVAALAPARPAKGATWILVRVWSQVLAGGDAVPAATQGEAPVAVESLKEDVRAAGLSLVPGAAPDGGHESLLLRRSQSGFAAVARGEPVRRFEVGGRPLGGDVADRGLEVSADVTTRGTLRLELAPAFRNLPEAGGEEIRANALSCAIELAEGQVVRIGASADAGSAVLRAVFECPDGPARALWLQAEVVR